MEIMEFSKEPYTVPIRPKESSLLQAPEVLTYGGMTEDGKYRGYGRAIDIWSIGCVVLEMVGIL